MNRSRRSFLAASTLLATTALAESKTFLRQEKTKRAASGALKLRFRPYTLALRHVFTLAPSPRTTTPVVLTEIEYDGVIGHGEASMPPYLGESHETATAFLSKLDLSGYKNPFELEPILGHIDRIAPGNPAAKASLDIARPDLVGNV